MASDRHCNSDQDGLTLMIRPARIAKILFFLVLTLAIVGFFANIVIYQIAPSPEHKIARLMQRLDLGHEPSIPAWYSSFALLFSAALLALIAGACRRNHGRFVVHWAVLSVVFVLMALDEAVMFHEMVDNVLHDMLQSDGAFYFAWVIPALVFVTLFGFSYLRFLWALNARTRWLFIAAGSIFVGGAVGMEMVAGVIISSSGVESIYHSISQTIEESCEMFGIVLFIYALLDYINRHIGPIRFQSPPLPADPSMTAN